MDTEEDVLYQKDVSFSAELEVAPPSKLSDNDLILDSNTISHRDDYKKTTPLPRSKNYAYTGNTFCCFGACFVHIFH